MKLRIEGETKVEAKVHFKDNSLVIASLCALIDIHINLYYLFIYFEKISSCDHK